MKKPNYLIAGLFMVAAMTSCDEGMVEDNDLMSLKKASARIGVSLPVSVPGGITPLIIDGANNGGNRTCTEVAKAWGLPENYFECGDKIDYTDGKFARAFPEGLNVTTDGKYVSFEMTDCLLIGDMYYKVGAVIVKGSNASNVYYYPEGTTSDGGLASPVNGSGNRAGLSNLTFCFVECGQPSGWVIALKTYVTTTGGRDWAISGGEGSNTNALYMGYNDFIFNSQNIYPLLFQYSHTQIGTITATDYMEDNVHYLEVAVDTYSDDYSFLESYLYVGTLEGYNLYSTLKSDGLYYTDFLGFPFVESEITGTRLFKIPFDEITE